MVWVNPRLEKLLAGEPGIVAIRRETAEEIAATAKWRLSQHRETGHADIVVEHSRLDSDVILDDPASLAIEFGRGEFTRTDGRRVGGMEGLRILRDSV